MEVRGDAGGGSPQSSNLLPCIPFDKWCSNVKPVTAPCVGQESMETNFDSGYDDTPQDSPSTSGQQISAPNEQETVESADKELENEMEKTGVNSSFVADEADLEYFDTLANPSPRTTEESEELQQVKANVNSKLTLQALDVDVPGDESRIWGVTLDLIAKEGDPREILTTSNRAPSFMAFSDSDRVIIESHHVQLAKEDETEVDPVFPLNFEELHREDKDDILRLVLARVFKGLRALDFNVKSQIIGEAALKLANELGISGFKMPGDTWLKTWKTNFLFDPYAFSFGLQVGRIVDRIEGNFLHRNIYLTGRRLGRNNTQAVRDYSRKFPSPFFNMSLENWVGKTCTTTQGKLRVVISINSLTGVPQKKRKIVGVPAFRSALPPLEPAPAPEPILTSTRLRQRLKPKPKASSKRPSSGKCMKAIIRYTEAIEASEVSSASIGPPVEPQPSSSTSAVIPEEPQPNPTSPVERLEATEISDLEFDENLFDVDLEELITDDQINALCETGDGDEGALISWSGSDTETE